MRRRAWTGSRLVGCLIIALVALIGLAVSHGVRRFAFGLSGRTPEAPSPNAQSAPDVPSPRPDGPSRPPPGRLRALPSIPMEVTTSLQPAVGKGSIVTVAQVQAIRAHLAQERLRPVEERLRLGGSLAGPGEAWQGQADGIRKELKDSLVGVPAASISEGQCNQVGCRFSIESADANTDVSARGRLAQLLRGDTRNPFPGEAIVSEALVGAKGAVRRVVVLFREPAPGPEDPVPSEPADGGQPL